MKKLSAVLLSVLFSGIVMGQVKMVKIKKIRNRNVEWIEAWEYYYDHELAKDYHVKRDSLRRLYPGNVEINYRGGRQPGSKYEFYSYYYSYHLISFHYYLILRISAKSHILELFYYKGKCDKGIEQAIEAENEFSKAGVAHLFPLTPLIYAYK